MAALNRESLLSSPDLLGKSVSNTTSSPAKPAQRVQMSTPKKSKLDAGNNIQLQDFYLTTPEAGLTRLNSPTRSAAQTENLISPWRIRVRVEAEREDGTVTGRRSSRGVSASPSKRSAARTKTTTVPLKGGDDTPPKRGRGRPRKSVGTPAKRPGTPKPTKASRKSQASNVESELGEDLPSKRSPKKDNTRSNGQASSARTIEDQEGLDDATARLELPEAGSTLPPKKTRARRKTIAPVDIAVDADTNLNDDMGVTGHGTEDSDNLRVVEITSTGHQDTGQASNRYTRQNANTSRKSPSRSPAKRPLGQLCSLSPQKGRKRDFVNKINDILPQDPTDDHLEFDSIVESEEFTMISLDSLPSAQQHLNLSERNKTLAHGAPAHKAVVQMRSDSLQPARPNAMSNDLIQTRGRKISQLNSSPQGYGNTIEDSMFAPNSSLHIVTKQRTPSQLFSSPTLPPLLHQAHPPTSPRAIDLPSQGTPKLVKVVRAGIALQGVLDPVDTTVRSSGIPVAEPSTAIERSPRERLDDLFSGFGVGTRRELKAGLRLGEELAKRQRLASQAAASIQGSEDDVFMEMAAAATPDVPASDRVHYALSIPSASESGQAVHYPNLSKQQLPSPELSLTENSKDQMDWKADSPEQNAPTSSRATRQAGIKTDMTPTDENFAASTEDLGPGKPTQALTRAEADELQWQQERNAVSKQICEANSSQVMVIDSDMPTPSQFRQSDSEDEQVAAAPAELTVDIWQVEAQDSSHIENSTNSVDSLMLKEAVRPRRSKLPTPWRRQSQRQVIYSDELTSPIKQAWNSASKHAASPPKTEVRKRARYSSSDQFDHLDKSKSSELGTSQQKDLYEMQIPTTLVREVKDVFSTTVEVGLKGRDSEQNHVVDSRRTVTNSHVESGVGEEPPTLDESGEDIGQEQSSRFEELAEHEDGGDEHSFNEGGISEHASVKPSAHTSTSSANSMPPPATSSIKPVSQDLPPQSWLTSAITAVVPNFTSWFNPTTPHAAQQPGKFFTTPASYCEGNDNPSFSVYKPFNKTHYLRLRALYVPASQLPKTPHKRHSPPKSTSLSAAFLGLEIESLGWRKQIEAWELAVVDEFMALLRVEGTHEHGYDGLKATTSTNRRAERIGEEEVVKRVFSLWAGQVQRGKMELREGQAGAWDRRLERKREGVLARQEEWRRGVSKVGKWERRRSGGRRE